MAFRIYNTLTKSLEDFQAVNADGGVTFYSCGPTVYDDAHIGNFRTFVLADLLRDVVHRVVGRVQRIDPLEGH